MYIHPSLISYPSNYIIVISQEHEHLHLVSINSYLQQHENLRKKVQKYKIIKKLQKEKIHKHLHSYLLLRL